ncbi:hypothetical protein D3C80_1623650 [compost metagenome]
MALRVAQAAFQHLLVAGGNEGNAQRLLIIRQVLLPVGLKALLEAVQKTQAPEVGLEVFGTYRQARVGGIARWLRASIQTVEHQVGRCIAELAWWLQALDQGQRPAWWQACPVAVVEAAVACGRFALPVA